MRRVFTILGVALAAILLLLCAAFAYAQTPIGKRQIGGAIERGLPVAERADFANEAWVDAVIAGAHKFIYRDICEAH